MYSTGQQNMYFLIIYMTDIFKIKSLNFRLLSNLIFGLTSYLVTDVYTTEYVCLS